MEKWWDTYLTHYEQVVEHAANQLAADSEVDELTLDKEVQESIRNALWVGQLDLTIAASPGAEDDKDNNGNGDAENDESGGDDSGAKNGGAPPGKSWSHETKDSIKVPIVLVWYWNAIMRDLWKNASSSQ